MNFKIKYAIKFTPLCFIVVDIYYSDLYLPATGCLPENENGKNGLSAAS